MGSFCRGHEVHTAIAFGGLLNEFDDLTLRLALLTQNSLLFCLLLLQLCL